ncbi:hypothetical protein TNIN_375091 [Trichonephila inaurata madagascariensis]|uniref:Uncharacterized protein n=1 Tax=Trichonephila inaurata madagascariensis TaxID=2747483 RepID=A0A8X6YJL0_9ARAC|nr:hypothetical protein TNIN_375091 [Trichonephila inaurata madagascariensis]
MKNTIWCQGDNMAGNLRIKLVAREIFAESHVRTFFSQEIRSLEKLLHIHIKYDETYKGLKGFGYGYCVVNGNVDIAIQMCEKLRVAVVDC